MGSASSLLSGSNRPKNSVPIPIATNEDIFQANPPSYNQDDSQVQRLQLEFVNDSRITSSTPRISPEQEANVPYTPTGDEASIYKYYCPLCMSYFRCILKTKCCTNYLCYRCTKDYLKSKGIEKLENIDEFENHLLAKELYCPHCQTSGFYPTKVGSSEIIRDYTMSIPKHNIAHPSPIRVGETFEDLKRKIIPFKSLHSNSAPMGASSSSSSKKFITDDGLKDNIEDPRATSGIAMLDMSPLNMPTATPSDNSDSAFATLQTGRASEDDNLTRLVNNSNLISETLSTPMTKKGPQGRHLEDVDDDDAMSEYLDPLEDSVVSSTMINKMEILDKFDDSHTLAAEMVSKIFTDILFRPLQ